MRVPEKEGNFVRGNSYVKDNKKSVVTCDCALFGQLDYYCFGGIPDTITF